MRFKKTIFIAAIVIATLLICEMLLRLFGYRPGVSRSLSGFEVVDSLILYKNFTTDEVGIYKFSPWVTDSLQRYMNPQTGEIENPVVKSSLRHTDNFQDVCFQFLQLNKNERCGTIKCRLKRWFDKEDWETEFVKAIQKIKTKPDHDEWEEAVLNYLQHPFNKEGFRSIEFKQHVTKRKRILIIGDSFVYGMSTSPFFNSFPDLLLARGYMVYTAGIPGTDPAQYAAIAQKYIPLLQPDIVVICFYEGNDYMRFARTPQAGEPHEHMTNAGFFNSAPYGVYLNAAQAYQYYQALVTIPDLASSAFNRFCAKSAIGGLVWHAAYNLNFTFDKYIAFDDSLQNIPADTTFTASRVQLIDSICHLNHTALLNIVIPENCAAHNAGKKYLVIDSVSAQRVFGDKKYYAPQHLDNELDFPKNDYHFNNTGSVKFTNFIERLITQNGIDSLHEKR